jgi:hypothetical protein
MRLCEILYNSPKVKAERAVQWTKLQFQAVSLADFNLPHNEVNKLK